MNVNERTHMQCASRELTCSSREAYYIQFMNPYVTEGAVTAN